MVKRTLLLIAIAAWILLPTGTPDDIITVFLINILGSLYWILLIILFIAMWHYKLTFKKIIGIGGQETRMFKKKMKGGKIKIPRW